jgi:predicted porin
MKKHLIAAAVAAIVAVPAAAQVTVYGNIDLNVSSRDTTAGGSADSGIAKGILSSSILGIRGTEDLGGGLKASFSLEGDLESSTGVVGSSTANQIFDRESHVQISGGFGSIRIGLTDVTSAQAIDSKVSQGGDLFIFSSQSSTDQSRVVRYMSPSFGGVTFEIGHARPNAAPTAGGEATVGNTTSGYIGYESGPLGVYAGHDSRKISAAYDQETQEFGIKYKFGDLGVGLALRYNDATTSGGVNGTDEQMASVSYALGGGMTVHAGIEKKESDTIVATDETLSTVALTKALSKRTTVYGAYLNGNLELTGNDYNQMTVGVRHTF